MTSSSTDNALPPWFRTLTDTRNGLLFWLVFGAIALALRGVRWDEDYEWAQIITGMVQYPEGHPLPRWIGNLATIQLYSAALLMKLSPDPAFVNAVRNLLFIWATVIPVYFLGAALSRRAIVGHLCAILILIGVHLEFDGAYPQFLWPGMFSNGHIGTGYALLWLSAVAFGRVRIAAVMLGLLPAIHMGHVPPCYLLAALWAAWAFLNRSGALRTAAPMFAAGLVVSIAFFAIQREFAMPAPTEGVYASAADPRAVWEGSVTHHDMHRSPPRGNAHILAASFLIVCFLLRDRWNGFSLRNALAPRAISDPALSAVALFGLAVLAIVYGIMTLHLVLGESMPYIFLGWLPYRLANLVPPMLIAMLLSTLARHPQGERFIALVASMIAISLAQPLAAAIISTELATRYFSSTDWILFALLGAAFVVLTPRITQSAIAAAVLLATLAIFHQFGAACAAAGMVIAFALTHIRVPKKVETIIGPKVRAEPALRASPFWSTTAALATGCLLSVAILRTEFLNRSHLPTGDLERGLAQYFDSHDIENSFLIVPPYQILAQAQTGQPVLTDLAMTYFIGYMPALGPSIQKMYSDIYGIDFTHPLSPAHSDSHWTHVWSMRSKDDWRSLAESYDFQFIIAPSDVPLALQPFLVGENDTAYQVAPSHQFAQRDPAD